MNNLFKCLTATVISLLLCTSCLDEGYALDDLDTNGEFNLPVIPLGSLDTMYFKDLPELPFEQLPPGIDTINFEAKFAVADTVRGLFDEDVSKNFFYDGKKTDSYIKGQLKRIKFPNASKLNITLGFEILDAQNQVLDIKIPLVRLYDQAGAPSSDVKIVIAKKYMAAMQTARNLRISVAVDTSLSLGDFKNNKSAFVIQNLELYAGSMAFEF